MIQAIMGTSTQQTATGVSWLRTCGTQLCDDQNRPVLILGPNWTGGDDKGLGLADIQRIKALGFNSIRVMMPWGRLQPHGSGLDGIDVTYFNGTGNWPLLHGLDQVVNWAVQENMYLLLTTYWSEWDPPPTWAFPKTSDDAARYTSLLNGTATTEMTGIMNLWRYVAGRYRNVPNIVFELLNEPNVLNDSLAGNAYKIFNENIISAIESVETKSHLKVVELLMSDPDWQEIVDGATDLDKSNVAWAFHYYAPMTGWDPNASYWHGSFTWLGKNYPEGWGNGTTYVIWRISRVGDKVRHWNRPLVVTEFAKDTTQPDWKQWYDVVLSTIAYYDSSGLILHEYGNNPQFNVGYNINNPTTRLDVISVLDSHLGTATLTQTVTMTQRQPGGANNITITQAATQTQTVLVSRSVVASTSSSSTKTRFTREACRAQVVAYCLLPTQDGSP